MYGEIIVMTSEEELYKKLLNNEFIEEGVGWSENDSYYCENEDNDLISLLKMNMDSDFSIKNIVFTFSQVLRKRYHNNFYLEFVLSQEELLFILRGQPILNSTKMNIIVKYSLKICLDDCTLKTCYITPKDSDFSYEKYYVDNYNETNQNTEIVDNSSSIKLLLDSISLRNYVNKINVSSSKKTIQPVVEAESLETKPINGKTESVIYCPQCGEANFSLKRKCRKCKTTLVSYITDFGREIESFDEILSDEAIEKIQKTKIPQEFYEYVLETIINKCKRIDFSEDISVFDKILRIARKFVNVYFEYTPNKNIYGSYLFDTVKINSNQTTSQQCSSLIRYLSVEIHLEIMEAMFMYIFDVKNNARLRAFIDSSRAANMNEKIIHNYYPLQVEAHYIPPEYHSYDEITDLYNYCVTYKKLIDPKKFESDLIVGNTFAQEIIRILDKVIDDDMKKDLAVEFIYDETVPVKAKIININEVLSYNKLIKAIKTSLIDTIKNIMESEDIYKKLCENQEKYEGKGSSI